MKAWKCSNCKCERIEEVLEGVTQTSVITGIEAINDDGDIVFDYGEISCDGGDFDTIRFQCVDCGNPLSPDELRALL